VTPAVLTEPRSSVSFPIGQVEHPSALSKFDQVVAASKGKQIVVFLDYDGTLSPIVDDPDAAYMSDTVPAPAPPVVLFRRPSSTRRASLSPACL